MSLQHFKELVDQEIRQLVDAQTSYLVNQTTADVALLRLFQGRIAGLQMARDVLSENYRKMFG